MSSSSSYNSLPLKDYNLTLGQDNEDAIIVEEILNKLKSATIDDLTSQAYDSWIFYCQFEKDQNRWKGNIVLGRETWDVDRLKRWDKWKLDLEGRCAP